MVIEDLLGFFSSLGTNGSRLLVSLIVIFAIALACRFISRSISRVSKGIELDPHIQNSLRLVLRVLTLLVAASALLAVLEIPLTVFLGGSALVGAALGFGSSQTINNIVAGFYVIASRPFRIKDYVAIGDVEAQVEEISINYTKIYTPSFNLLLIPNAQVISSRVMNLTHEEVIEYVFTLDMPHSMISSNETVIRQCIEPAITEFEKKYSDMHLRRPESFFDTSTAFSRTFKVRIFVQKGDAKALYSLQPELANMIVDRWDAARNQ